MEHANRRFALPAGFLKVSIAAFGTRHDRLFCNVLSDHDVRTALTAVAPRTTGQAHGRLGCSVQCGCARTSAGS
jgi:hypothetical protein